MPSTDTTGQAPLGYCGASDAPISSTRNFIFLCFSWGTVAVVSWLEVAKKFPQDLKGTWMISVSGCSEGRDRSREIYLKCISNLFPFPFKGTKQISFVFCLSYTFELFIFLFEKAGPFGTQFFFLSIAQSFGCQNKENLIWSLEIQPKENTQGQILEDK